MTALARYVRALLWRQALVWAGLFGIDAYGTVKAYKAAYPTAADRLKVAAQVSRNPGFRALYGRAHHLDTLGGYAAWRVGGSLVVVAGIWGLLAATRLLRGEEEAGRTELVRSGAVSARAVIVAGLIGLGAAFAVTWALLMLGLVAAGVAWAGSAMLALTITASAAAFAAVGALTSQLAVERRRAATFAAVVLGASVLLRVAADGSPPVSWLRWATPFGWLEQVRPFAGSRFSPLLLVIAVTAGLAGLAVYIVGRRDIGSAIGPLADDSRVASRFSLLSGPLPFAIRQRWGAVVTWAASLGAFAFVMGLLAKDVADFASTGRALQKFASRLGGAGLNRAVGFVGLIFGFFVVVLVLYVVAGLAASREEEASGRLELILARAVGRRSWLSAALLAIAAGAAIVILASAGLIWAGGELRGAPVGIGRLLVGALNCLPVAVLFAGAGSLAFAFIPRMTAPLAYGAVTVTYLLQLVGALTKAPGWVLDLSPFHHVAAAPAVPVNAGAAAAMIVIGVVAAVLSTVRFARRDLEGA